MQGTLARKLRVLRAERGLTLRGAEELTGVDKDTLSKIERGLRHPYDVTLSKLAKGYGVPVEDLLEEPVLTTGKAEAPEEAGPQKQLPEEAGVERHPNDEVTQRRIFTGLAEVRADLLESMAELWDRLLDRG